MSYKVRDTIKTLKDLREEIDALWEAAQEEEDERVREEVRAYCEELKKKFREKQIRERLK